MKLLLKSGIVPMHMSYFRKEIFFACSCEKNSFYFLDKIPVLKVDRLKELNIKTKLRCFISDLF